MKLFNSSAVDEGCGGFFPHYRIKKKTNQPHFCDYKKKLKKNQEHSHFWQILNCMGQGEFDWDEFDWNTASGCFVKDVKDLKQYCVILLINQLGIQQKT